MSAAQLEESRRRIATFKPKNTEQKESCGDRLIARLAGLGDLESQAIVLANSFICAGRFHPKSVAKYGAETKVNV